MEQADLFPADQPEQAEAESERSEPLYSPPERACLVCGQRAWKWNPATQTYECRGDQAAHAAYTAWHQATFPWLQAKREAHGNDD